MTVLNRRGPGLRAGVLGTLRQAHTCSAGNAMLEFAMVFPAVIAVVLTTLQIGLAMHNYLSMDKAVRGAARLVARLPDASGGGATYASTKAKEFLTYELVRAGANAVADPTISWPDAKTVRVVATATFPYPLSSLLPAPTTLSVTHDQPYLGE